MKDWDAQSWVIFFTAAGIFAGAISTSIVAIVKAVRADARSKAADAKLDVVKERQDRASVRVGAVEAQAFKAVAMADPRVAEKVLSQPPPKGTE